MNKNVRANVLRTPQGISPDSIHSYNRWMRETFFNHVNIAEENIHIPQGNIPIDDVDAFYRVFCVNMRDLGSPVHDVRIFGDGLDATNYYGVTVSMDGSLVGQALRPGFKLEGDDAGGRGQQQREQVGVAELAQPDEFVADRCGDQPWQLRRPVMRHQWPRDRH